MRAVGLIVLFILVGIIPICHGGNRSTKIILWIVPWGLREYTQDVPKWAYPGIVFAYDYDHDITKNFLLHWFDTSLETLVKYLAENRTVFVMLFCEKYYPTWKWRGEIPDIKLSEAIITRLSEVTEGGKNVYIGFSELRACISNATCLDKLIKTYEEIKTRLPLAKLFYYGSGDESVGNIYKLYMGAGLDLVGYNIWSYEIRNNKLIPSLGLVIKLKVLKWLVGAERLLVGEIGFRRDDSKGYVNPWDWKRTYGEREEEADARYYSQALTYLVREVRPSYIGIWSWNDMTYSVAIERDVEKVLERFSNL